jgi:hypothetical protein
VLRGRERGEAPADKRRWRVARWRRLVLRQRWHVERMRGQRQCVERTRGGGSATTGVTQQTDGKQEANGRGVFADKRGWIVKRTRSSSSATRGVVTISWRH